MKMFRADHVVYNHASGRNIARIYYAEGIDTLYDISVKSSAITKMMAEQENTFISLPVGYLARYIVAEGN